MSYAFKQPKSRRVTHQPTAVRDSGRRRDIAPVINRNSGISSRPATIADSIKLNNATALPNRHSGLPVAPRSITSLPNLSQPVVTRLPRTQKAPIWVRSLLKLHQGSMIVTFLLISAALSVYGWTVYSQQLWSQQYQKLVTLQRTERGMTAYGEVMKNNLAQQAQQAGTELIAQTPSNTIFLQPAPPRPNKQTDANKPEQKAPTSKVPLGY
jgi:hypothetical protein